MNSIKGSRKKWIPLRDSKKKRTSKKKKVKKITQFTEKQNTLFSYQGEDDSESFLKGNLVKRGYDKKETYGNLQNLLNRTCSEEFCFSRR